MANLSTSNLLWYIYQRNRAVGYPTVISMQQFLHEFPCASRNDIVRELDNLINGMNFVHRRFVCVYDLIEDGLKEVLHLEKFVPSPIPKVWWVSLLQLVACWVSKPNKAITVALVMMSVCGMVYGEDVGSPVSPLPVIVNGGILSSNSAQRIRAQEQRIYELLAKVEAAVAKAEGTLSNKVGQLSSEYEAKLKKRLGEVDVEIGDAVRDREFYAKRHAELKSEYASAYTNLRDDYDKFVGRLGYWLTLIGIFVALLGIGVPAVATFLQWKNIKAGIADLKHGKDAELSQLRRESVRSLHMCLLQSVKAVDMGTPTAPLDMINVICSIIICFDDLLECAMRTKDEGIVKDEVGAFRPFLERWSNSDMTERRNIWAECVKLLRSAIKNRKDMSRRKEFAELLGENSETFKWLENFYGRFAEWKFT